MTTRNRRETTAPETTPAGNPAPTPVEDVPAPPAPAPEPDAPPEPSPPVTRAELSGAVAALVREELEGGRERWPLSVGEAIAEVTRRVGVIAKDRQASQGGSYKYRGIDDVLEALHPILGDVGLVLLPGEVRDARFETRATASGGTLNVARLLVRYRLLGPDGTETFGEAWGEGGDSGDKATQKAHSQSYKSFALQTFSIPTEQSSADEPDATNPASRPYSAEERQRAQNAWVAALAAASVADLANVRQRALHLLDVPIIGAEDALAPLSWHFDRRRAELDAAAGGAS